MQQRQELYLHIFSGCHIGAVIHIPQGKYILGTDDACDFIFMDKNMAPHHASLEVIEIPQKTENGGTEFQVKITPLEGKIFLEQQEADTEIPWEKEQLLSLQGVYLAWTDSSNPEILQQISKSMYAPQALQQPAADSTHDGQTNSDAPESDNNIGTSSEQDEDSINIVAENEENPDQKPSKKKNFLGAVLALAAICALAVTFTPIDSNEFKDIEKIQNYLADNGFPHIQAIVTDKGVLWQGILENDAERAKLHAMAQKMQFPIHLDIMVKSDIAKTFSNIFSLKNVYPTVTAGDEDIFLGYYVKDELFQQILLQYMKELLPHYDEIREKLNIKTIYAKELQELLNAKKDAYNIKTVNPIFEEGTILFTNKPSQEEQAQIQALMDDIQQELGFNIPYEFPAAAAAETYFPKKGNKAAPAEQSKTANFSVTGVTLGTIPFITLDTGEKIFIGGILPDGGILEQISLHELAVNHNGSITIFPLRGNQ